MLGNKKLFMINPKNWKGWAILFYEYELDRRVVEISAIFYLSYRIAQYDFFIEDSFI